MSVARSLLAIADGDRTAAIRLAEQATLDEPASLVAPALQRHLDDNAHTAVYAEPRGFADFIDNGGNPALYREVIRVLGQRTSSTDPRRVIDIGCGDGRVSAAVVEPDAELDLVEPSEALLRAAVDRLASHSAGIEGFAVPIQQFLAEHAGTWDLALSTFALHALPHSERLGVLEALASRADRLLIVEFDVPDFDDRSLEHATYAAEAFERGFREYQDLPLVLDDFLLPVLLGQFDPARPRLTHEQSRAQWVNDLRSSGWRSIEVAAVAPYWWAEAVLLDARGTASDVPR